MIFDLTDTSKTLNPLKILSLPSMFLTHMINSIILLYMRILESPYFWSSYWECTSSIHEPWPCFIWWLCIYHPQKYLPFLLSYPTEIKFLFKSGSGLTFCIFHRAPLNSMIQISPLAHYIQSFIHNYRINFLKSPSM